MKIAVAGAAGRMGHALIEAAAADQALLGLRGANHSSERRSSRRPTLPSIQPKHSASSTASS